MRSIAASSALIAATVAAVPSLAAQNDFHWSGRVAAGNEVEVIGIAADVDASPASGSAVEVTATGLEDGARVEVEPHAGGVTFCVIHAGMRRTGDGGRCNQEGRGMQYRRRHDDIEVHVKLPAGVRFSASTVSGDIDATGLAADVEAHSVSGDVQVSTRGAVEAASVSGDVQVRMGRLPEHGSLEFHTVSGNVDVSIPANAGAELRASTLSGEIESDFPLEMSGRNHNSGRGFHIEVGSRARGTIGRGGPRLELETVSGDIRVRRAER